MKFEHGQLIFDFTGCVSVEEFDRPGTPVPETMKKVDFVVQEPDRILLVEVKDPSNTATTAANRQEFIHNMKSGPLVHQDLVPKCRDNYTYLHLMNADCKPLVYVALIALYENQDKPVVLLALHDKLKKCLRQEVRDVWTRQYVSDCAVVNVKKWNQRFPYSVTRAGTEQSPAR